MAHKVSSGEAGQRLDALVARLPGVESRRKAQAAIESGKVTVDGQVCRESSRKIPAGAEIDLAWNKPGTSVAATRARQGLDEAGVRILFEDEWLVAVDKPAGLLTDSASRDQTLNHDTLRKRLAKYLRVQGDGVHIVHRIDRYTTGVVLCARDEETAELVRGQFQRHEPERAYWVAVQGVPEPRAGEWADWMNWDKAKLLQRPARPGAEGAVLAQASYEVQEIGRGCAILEVRLYTGRRNQIRLHCQLRGYPLIGEKLYLPEGWTPRGPTAPRQALHAKRLGLRHPRTGAALLFEAPLPPDLQKLEATLRAQAGRYQPQR